MSAGVLIPVGPGEIELERWAALMESLVAYEDAAHVVVVDDAEQPRSFDGASQVLRTSLPKGRFDPYSAMAAGTLTGMRALAEAGVEFMVKLDTDAFVIGPFTQALGAAFEDPRLGVAGRYRYDTAGTGRRDFTVHRGALVTAWLPVPLSTYRRDGRLRMYARPPGAQRRITATITRALRNGWEPGEHCQGGAYAVSGALLRTALDRGYLRHPADWTATRIPEDVLVGIIARACGFHFADDPLFAVKHVGLPAPPDQLRAGSYAITHSLKRDSLDEERALRVALRR
jgi:hypothetical protein